MARTWGRTPVDAFILEGLAKQGLTPSPEADRRTLLRRVTFDLTGLPPSPQEMRAFLADRAPKAYERVVKRLLASSAFGERWAQHWLDVVRFGETNGYELDAEREQAWRYRDWVVKALNADLPYDRFLKAQVAGDLIAPNDFEMHVATGFLRAGPQHVVGGNQDEAVNRQEWLTEATTGIGNAVLGLTIQCARCHDHKYDPIPQRDYYRLQAFFAATNNHAFGTPTSEQKARYDAAMAAHKARLEPLEKRIAEIEAPYRKSLRAKKEARLTPEQRQALATPEKVRTPVQRRLVEEAGIIRKIDWDELLAELSPSDRQRRAGLRAQLHRIEQDEPEPLPAAQCVADTLSPVPRTFVMKRGDPHAPGTEVTPGYPEALHRTATTQNLPPLFVGEGRGGGHFPSGKTIDRLALAEWLTTPDNPLTARVLVNRVWQILFGKGIVATPNDFGRNGQPPTHPALLDWLATTFVAGKSTDSTAGFRANWSLKRLISILVTSSVYRQSSAYDANKARSDRENRLLWRMNRRRMDAEALRDTILSAAGTLNRQEGGPPIRIPLEPEVVETVFSESEPDNLWPVTPDARQHTRRSLYLLHKRNVRIPMLAAFDQPDMMSSCAARGQSVHALQALTLLNSPFMAEQSRNLAARLWREVPVDEEARLQRLFLLCLNRPPTEKEANATRRFLLGQKRLLRERMQRGETLPQDASMPGAVPVTDAIAWTDLCLATMNLNEFAYVR